MLRELLSWRIAVLGLATGLSLCAVGLPIAAATATLAQEEQRGEGVAESLRGGERQCSDLSADEFESIGEYAMGSYLGNEAILAAMNRRMTAMMGEPGEHRMHTALGHRYSACSGGLTSGWVGPTAAMMSGSRYEGRGDRSGTMMGSRGYDHGGMGTLAVVLIALFAAAIGAGVTTLLMRQPRLRKDAAP